MSFLAFIKNGKKVKNNFMPAKYPASRVSYNDNGTETDVQTKVSELNADIASLITVEIKSERVSIGANTNSTANYNVTKTGYTPVLAVINDNSDGNLSYQKCIVSGNNAEVNIRNLNSVAVTITLSISVLYVKNI